MAAGHALWVAIVLSVSALIRGQNQNLVVSPPSVAATNGDQNITINCTLRNFTSGQTLQWTYRPSWAPINTDVLIFSTFNGINLTDTTNFSIDVYDSQSQGSQYKAFDLTIKLANPGQAATYKCELTPAYPVVIADSSSFIVLDPVQCPAQDLNEYAAGTVVNISCSVNYYNRDEYGRAPKIEIVLGDPGIPLPGVPTATNRTTQTVTVSHMLNKEDDNVEFYCRVSFHPDGPEYNDNCSFVYRVIHEVSEISFQPPSSSSNLTSIPVGGQISCITNGKPAPTITWYNYGGALIAEGINLTVTQDMLSWAQPASVVCRANNTINGGLNYTSVEGNYTFLVVGASSPPVVQSGMEGWMIAVCVIVPVVVLAAVAIAIFFIIRHRKKKKKKAKKSTNGSTIYNATTTTATTTTTSYTPVATSDPTYSSPNRPPPASAVPLNSALGPPGFDGRHDSVRYSPGFGDLGAQPPYGGSTHAVNAYPTRNSSSVSGSNQAIGGAAGLSMNPNPGGYQGAARASNPALNTSSSRPAYPYKGSNPHLDASLSMNPNPLAAAAPAGVEYGRQPSSAASSVTGRSLASGYNAQAMHGYPNDLSSMPGSEV